MTICVWKRIPCQLRASSVAVCIKSVSMGKFPQHEEMAFQGFWRGSSNGFGLFQESTQALGRKCTAASVTLQQFSVRFESRWDSSLNLQMLSLFVLNFVWRWILVVFFFSVIFLCCAFCLFVFCLFWFFGVFLGFFVLWFCFFLCKAGEKSDHHYQGTTDVKTTLENSWKNNYCFRTSLLLVWMMTCFSFNIPFEWVFDSWPLCSSGI